VDFQRSRTLRSVIVLAALIAIGIAGYMTIEGWSFLDAAYMTALTFTTVGFAEVHPLSSGGKAFSIFLMIAGVGATLYFLSISMQRIIEEGIFRGFVRRRRMETRLAGERNHFILCGFGRVGREVALAFQQEGAHFIIVEKDLEAISDADNMGFAYVLGDASDDEVLRAAGIERARGLVAATGNDSDNVFITLSARGIRPELFIVARTTYQDNEGKLIRAGANSVVSPHTIGGRRMALSAVRPMAVDFFDSLLDGRGKRDLRFTEITVGDGSVLLGSSILQCKESQGIDVLALARGENEMMVNPIGDLQIEENDRLFIVGPDTRLADLEGKA